jgi:hypothetical protein
MYSSNVRQYARRLAHPMAFKVVMGLGMLASTAPLLSAPVVQQVSGTLDHNGSITIRGSGFGSKPSAAPLVWDNATSSRLSDKWSGAWPNQLPGYNTDYYNPMRGINPPHPHDTRYIAGAHAANTGAYSGYNVMVFKTIPLPTLPYNIYASWYQRVDDQWHFGGDNNFKAFDYSDGSEPYASAGTTSKSWYLAYGPPHPESNTDTGAQWGTFGAAPLASPDINGHNSWWGSAVNPMAGKWSKIEVAIKATNQRDGYITVWENGRRVVNYAGSTDPVGGTQRTIAIGGYARMQGYSSNWRYYDDVYVDTTLSRVVLADQKVLNQATIIENQIPSDWSDSSITATVNLGKFTQGQTAYLFVVDASGTPSATGLAVTAGGSTNAPNPPAAVSVQ